MKVARCVYLTRPVDVNPDFVGPPLFAELISIRHSSESGNGHFEINCKNENSVCISIGELDRDSINISSQQWTDIRREVDAVFSEMDRLKNTNKWFLHTPNDGTHEWGIGSCPSCGYKLIKVKKTGFLFCSNHESICDYDREDAA